MKYSVIAVFFCIFLFTHIFPTLIISNAALGTEVEKLDWVISQAFFVCNYSAGLSTARQFLYLCSTHEFINNKVKYPIKTERLIIRLAEPEDAESIFSYRSDFAKNKYQGWFPDSVEEVRNYISNMPTIMDIAKY